MRKSIGFNMWISIKVVEGEFGYGGLVVVFFVCSLNFGYVVVVDLCYLDVVKNGNVKM